VLVAFGGVVVEVGLMLLSGWLTRAMVKVIKGVWCSWCMWIMA